MVRLKDIAARAGVSMMTVSKALRDEPDISAATKARLKQLAREMGYVPDIFAQALRTRVTKMYGVVIPTITNPVFSRMLMAIEERAHEIGYDLVVAHSMGTAEREELCLRRLIARHVEGLFIHPVYRLPKESAVFKEIETRKIPTVILGHLAPFCSQFVNVESDDLRGSLQITQHLLQLGHRRIAYFAGPIVAPSAQQRFEGYRRALREVGLDADEKLVFQAGSTIDDGAKAALQLLNETTDATAIQCDNDLVAIGAANTLLNQGIKIPDDISVTGFGNILAAEYFRVPLTTARQPKGRLGSAAIEVMLQLQRGERPETKRLAAELSQRASTAPPPAKPALARKTGT